MAGDVNFLLGTWVADAKGWGYNASQQDNRINNALNQITLWGPDGEINDYAAKQWSGLVSAYYQPRWSMLVDALVTSARTGTPVDWNAYYAAELALGRAFYTNTTQVFPVTPSGSTPIALAQAALLSYANGSTSDYTAQANTGLPPRPAVAWVPIANGSAAVGSDCPFEAHGDSSSLAACEAACAGDPMCNLVNWSPSIPDCVFRICSNPLKPQLTPYPDYDVYAYPSAASDVMVTTWNTDPTVLASMCDMDPLCAGFTSDGMLTTSTQGAAPKSGVTLYTKKAAHRDAAAAAPQPYEDGGDDFRLALPQPRHAMEARDAGEAAALVRRRQRAAHRGRAV